jgi:hypothetical protein
LYKDISVAGEIGLYCRSKGLWPGQFNDLLVLGNDGREFDPPLSLSGN